jgi:hypothetical protein
MKNVYQGKRQCANAFVADYRVKNTNSIYGIITKKCNVRIDVIAFYCRIGSLDTFNEICGDHV